MIKLCFGSKDLCHKFPLREKIIVVVTLISVLNRGEMKIRGALNVGLITATERRTNRFPKERRDLSFFRDSDRPIRTTRDPFDLLLSLVSDRRARRRGEGDQT